MKEKKITKEIKFLERRLLTTRELTQQKKYIRQINALSKRLRTIEARS